MLKIGSSPGVVPGDWLLERFVVVIRAYSDISTFVKLFQWPVTPIQWPVTLTPSTCHLLIRMRSGTLRLLSG